MAESLARAPRPVADKRAALLAAALRLIARTGLHATTTAAVAREAGVAAGTLYLYFPSKEALINALYLELVAEQHRAAATGIEAADAEAARDAREGLWRAWHGLARWHLDRPDETRVMPQLRASGYLTTETRAAEQDATAAGRARFREAIAAGALRDLPVRSFWALYAGPILALAEPGHDDPAVTDEVLRAAFDGVCRAVLP